MSDLSLLEIPLSTCILHHTEITLISLFEMFEDTKEVIINHIYQRIDSTLANRIKK